MNEEYERAIEAAARIIDAHAFVPNADEAHQRRQQSATRKATDILSGPLAVIEELVGELAAAQHQIKGWLAVAAQLTDNFQEQLGPGIERRAQVLSRYGRPPDE